MTSDPILDFDINKYSSFKRLEKLDEGGYGVVYKVQDKSTKNIFAIKKILISGQNELESTQKEINTNIKLKSEYIVDFIGAWRDDQFVYIQMKLYKDNLRNILELKPEVFGRASSTPINSLEFYLSCNLFKEVTECLNYLHNLSPIIMHRDLKPANILISDGKDGHFLKLCDFVLSKDYMKSSNTRFVGTGKYVAWENKDSRTYNYKIDIFSLCVIGLEIFGFKFNERMKIIICNKWLTPYLGTNLERNFRKLLEVMSFCLAEDTVYSDRYSCPELLVKIDEFTIDKIFVLSDNFANNLQVVERSKNEFFINYLKNKMDKIS